MMYYAELADHDGPTTAGNTSYRNRSRRSSTANRSSNDTMSLNLDDLIGSSQESLDSVCQDMQEKMNIGGRGNAIGVGGGLYNRGRISRSSNNSSFFDLGEDFFDETDEDENDVDDEETDQHRQQEDKSTTTDLHEQIRRLDDSKLSKKALMATKNHPHHHERMSMSENWAYSAAVKSASIDDNGDDGGRLQVNCTSGMIRKVHFSHTEPEIYEFQKMFPEDYPCLYYDEAELQRMFDDFRQEEREARRHSLR